MFQTYLDGLKEDNEMSVDFVIFSNKKREAQVKVSVIGVRKIVIPIKQIMDPLPESLKTMNLEFQFPEEYANPADNSTMTKWYKLQDLLEKKVAKLLNNDEDVGSSSLLDFMGKQKFPFGASFRWETGRSNDIVALCLNYIPIDTEWLNNSKLEFDAHVNLATIPPSPPVELYKSKFPDALVPLPIVVTLEEGTKQFAQFLSENPEFVKDAIFEAGANLRDMEELKRPLADVKLIYNVLATAKPTKQSKKMLRLDPLLQPESGIGIHCKF